MLQIRDSRHRSSKERGSALVLAVLLVMVMTVLGLGLVFVSEVERDIAIHDQRAKLAREIARSALTHAKFCLIDALEDDDLSNDLKGEPVTGTTVAAEYLCINQDADARDECRGCLRTTDTDSGQCKASDRRMQAVPLYDYKQGTFLVMRPYLEKSEPFTTPASAPGPTIKGYFSVWIRNNPDEIGGVPANPDPQFPGKAGTDIDKDVLLIAEVWIKKYPEPFDNWFNAADKEVATQGTLENPIVARVVLTELITKEALPLLAYSGRNIDLHNTNTIYV